MSEPISKKISIISLVFLSALAVFTYGLAVGNFKIWPFKTIESIYSATLSLIRYGELVPANRLIKAPDYVSREKYVAHDKSKIQSGFYAYMGYDGDNHRYVVWLFDDNGNKIHDWDLSYLPLDEDGPLNGSDSPHAFKLLSDGSVIVSFDSGDVMARIDQCSQPIWTKQGVYHHAMERANDGTYWVWRGDNTAYAHYNYIENFDPKDGRTITEIGLIEDLIKSPDTEANVFGLRPDYPFERFNKTPKNEDKYDFFHPNDVDVLSDDMADKFENFEAGDLLLSFRSLHLITVVDPKSKTIKWWHTGPWVYQHDPDFTSDGKISVYSNNTYLGRSEIIKIDPLTHKVFNELKDGNLFFYSKYQGKHQYLPNGNILITIPDEGRVVQVTSKGDMVFEFNNVSAISSKFNEHIANAIWFDKDYFNAIPTCSN